MKIIFYILSIYPLKLAFYMCDVVLKVLPLGILRTLTPFKVTRKNLSIAFPNLSSQELDSFAKASYLETIKSFYETLYTWSRSSTKIIYHTKKINNRFLFNTNAKKDGLIIFALHNRSIDFFLRWISVLSTAKVLFVDVYVYNIKQRG